MVLVWWGLFNIFINKFTWSFGLFELKDKIYSLWQSKMCNKMVHWWKSHMIFKLQIMLRIKNILKIPVANNKKRHLKIKLALVWKCIFSLVCECKKIPKNKILYLVREEGKQKKMRRPCRKVIKLAERS